MQELASARLVVLLLGAFLGAHQCIWARDALRTVRGASLCSIQKNPKAFSRARVEVHGTIVTGLDGDQLYEGKCSFPIAYGDDYQTFGARFQVTHDAQWDLLRTLIRAPNDCTSKTKRIKLTLVGTVETASSSGGPATNETGSEIVIQSVSEVERVHVDCTSPSPTRR